MKSGGSSHGSLFIVICDEKGDGLTLCEQTPISLCVHPLSCKVQKLCTYLHGHPREMMKSIIMKACLAIVFMTKMMV
jgi:hypothetical protein